MKRFKVQSLNGVRLYNEKRTYKIDDVVEHNSVIYQNVLGKSSVPGLDDNWISISEKVVKDFVSVRDFGALGNGFWNGTEYNGTDDTLAIQTALNSGENIYFPDGFYLISSDLIPSSNTEIFCDTKQSANLIFNGVVNGNASTYFNIFNIVDKQNITFKNLGFADGSHKGYEELLTFSEACIGIRIFGSTTKNISVFNCDFSFIHGHGVYDGSEESYNNYFYNSGDGVGQNILNINSKFPTIHYNKGCNSGFGLIEASCGNGSIQFNEAWDNIKKGITIGGFAGPISSGYGSNNIISHNKCYGNLEDGIHLSAHCVDSIISENICYQNSRYGISTNEPNDLQSNLLITKNKLFDNGLISEIGKGGILIISKGNTITDNEIYNTGLPNYFSTYGITIDIEKHNQIIKRNQFKNITNWEISIFENNNIEIEQNPNDRIELLGNVNIKDKVFKVGIGYDGQPITNIQTYVWADNVSSPKTAILPDAEKYPEGQILTVVDEKGSAGTNNIILQTVSGNKINGVVDAEYVLNNNYETLQLTNVKSQKNWIVLNKQGESRTGWARYKDTQYTVSSPLNVPSGTTIILPNNALSIINNEIPSDTVSFYNPATKKITPTNNGDFYIINVRFKAKTSVVNDGLLVDINIGGALGVISEESKSFIRGANSEQKFNLVFTTFSGATFLANGGDVRLTTLNGNLQLYDIDYVIKRTHKSKLL